MRKRNSKKFLMLLVLFPLSSFFYCNSEESSDLNDSSDIKTPPGFKIDIYADNVENARSMVLSESGVLFVGTRDAGNVYAVLDTNKDFKADRVITIARGLNKPNGVALKDGNLYLAEVNRVWRYDDIEANLENPPQPVLVSDGFPADEHHGWKYIAFGPDDKLYVPVGAPCNICYREDKRYSSIMRMNTDGSDLEVYVHGIRNTVGFDWHPSTNELWFTDNGRDMMGDDVPPDELNRVTEKDQHFGFPFVHGTNIPDDDHGENVDFNKYTTPVQDLGPHVAALGMEFYTGDMFPSEYRNQIFIAEHGSWNRSRKIGYRVMLVKLNGNEAVSYEPFAEGWLDGESVTGRPVDIETMNDGSLLVSDDYAGVIYRITYNN